MVSKAENIRKLIENNPKLIFNSKIICDFYSKIYGEEINPNSVTTILTRLHRKGFIQRTKTERKDGYLYSKDNNKGLEVLYDHYLLPYEFEDREKIIELITRQDFEELRENDVFCQDMSEDLHCFLALNVGFLMCDGHIRTDLDQISYFIYRKQDAEELKLLLKSFWRNKKISMNKTPHCYSVGLCNRSLARFFNGLGVPVGKKVYQPFIIPEWIYHGSREVKRIFLSTVIGNEGGKSQNNKWRISFVLSKHKDHVPNLLIFLNQIRAMLKFFEISSTHIQIRKQKGRNFCGRFYIKGKEDILKFHRELAFFYASEKQEVLEELVYSK